MWGGNSFNTHLWSHLTKIWPSLNSMKWQLLFELWHISKHSLNYILSVAVSSIAELPIKRRNHRSWMMNFWNNGLQPQVPSFFHPWKTLVRQRYLQFLRTTNKIESCKERIKCTLKQQNRCRIIRKSNKTIHKPLFKTQNSSAFQELHFSYVLLLPYNDLRKYFSVRSLPFLPIARRWNIID